VYLERILRSEGFKVPHNTIHMVLVKNGLSPDFKTIADFRKDNVDNIKKVFRKFTKLCTRLDLFSNELVGIDGTKVKAVNSRTRNFNAENLESRIKRVKERLAEYMKNMDENDKAERLTREELKEKIEKLKIIKQKYLSLKQELNGKNIKEVSLTDPDSRLMKLPNNGFDICYNVQAAVDKKNHLIVNYDVVNSSSDYNQLSSMALKAEEALNVKNQDVIADMGYFDSNEIKACIDNGVTPFVPERKYASPTKYSTGVPAPEFGEDKFVYNRCSDSYMCPAGFELKYFKTKFNYGRRMRMYSTQACNSKCQFRAKCTAAKGGRIIYRWEHQDIIDKMNDVMKTPGERCSWTLEGNLSNISLGRSRGRSTRAISFSRVLKRCRGKLHLPCSPIT
jgi:hypothetical protein